MRPGTLAWILAGGFLITATTGLVLLSYVPDEVLRREGNSLPLTAAFLVGTLAFSVVGAIVAQHQPRNPIGWLFVALAVVEGWSGLAFAWASYSLEVAALPAATYAAWFATWASVLAPGFIAFCFLLFPDGRLLSPRWRVAAWVSLGLFAIVVARFALVPGPLSDFPAVRNPFGVDALEPLTALPEDLLFSPLLACAAAALVVRLRRSRGVERQQVKWFAYSAAMIPAFLIAGGTISALTGAADDSAMGHAFAFLFALILAGLPISAGVAILRYRLYDIDLVINRTLVYGGADRRAGGDVPRAGAAAPGRARPAGRRAPTSRWRLDPGRGRPVPAGARAHPGRGRPPLLPAAGTTPPAPSRRSPGGSGRRSTSTRSAPTCAPSSATTDAARPRLAVAAGARHEATPPRVASPAAS